MYSKSARWGSVSILLLSLLGGVCTSITPVSATEAGYQSPQSQKITVTGIIRDASGQPVIGAGVIEEGSAANGTITDESGRFSLAVQKGANVKVTCIGYDDYVFHAETTSPMNITLSEDSKLLEEVVVIGYGTVKKKDLTGSVASFRKKDMSQGVNPSLSALLEGRAAGVIVTQSSAEPGGGISVQVRGAGSVNASSSPLYVIDGLPIETNNVVSGQGASVPGVSAARNPLSGINPSDIESIEVLKDASATAIYGARGANGVILVTTKKGASGKAKVTYDGSVGIQMPKKMIDVLNAEDYKRILNEIQATEGSGVAANEIVGDIQDGGTDWQGELLRKSVVHSHSLSLAGGTNNVKYYASMNYFGQDGVLKTSAYDRYDGRVNVEYTGKKLKAGANISTSYTKDKVVPLGYNTNEEGGVLYAARNFDPTLAIKNEDGTYQRSDFLNVDNPIAILYGKTSTTNNYRTLGTAFAEYTILDGWKIKANVGFDVRNSRRDTYVSQLTKDGRANSGVGNIFTGTRGNWLAELTSTYNKDFRNNSSLSTLIGATFQKFTMQSFNGTAKGFPVDNVLTNNMGMGDAELFKMGSSMENNKLLSFIGRVNYSLKDTYLFTVTMRVDGSSKFGANNKFGYFPSGAFALKLNNYDFIRNLNTFDDLKLRLSYGRTGNQDIGNYMSITTFGTGGKIDLDNSLQISLEPSRLANPDLKWETTSQYNVGLDMAFFKSRLSVTAEYFYKYTSDMLFNRPIPASTGYSQRLENVGDISNQGFELTINSRNIEGVFSWNTSFNLGTLKNRVENLGGIPDMIHTGAGQTTSQIAIIREGEALNSFYGYETAGIWQSEDEIKASGTKDNVRPGDIKFVDQNGDNVVSSDDRVIIGKSIPSVTMGFGNEFIWKGFNLNIFFDGAFGFQMLNNSVVESYYPVSHRRNRIAELYKNRWTPENPSTKYPSFVNPNRQGVRPVNDLTVEDASYFRLQTLQLTYNVPLKTDKLSNLAFYILGQNLFTITKYSGQDPAFNSNNSSTLRIDFNSYPTYRTVTLGMNISF
ncbi:MAG: SusC/RagA family TonB-linked outer membrane protein [Candidatus Cryptobacteroides sp.]